METIKDEQCFSCYDHMQFQIFGQTDEYRNTNHSLVYLENYQVGTVIECMLCDRKVEYQKQENGRWSEVELPL